LQRYNIYVEWQRKLGFFWKGRAKPCANMQGTEAKNGGAKPHRAEQTSNGRKRRTKTKTKDEDENERRGN